MAKKIETDVDPLAWLVDKIQVETQLQDGEFTSAEATEAITKKRGSTITRRAVQQMLYDMEERGEIVSRTGRIGGVVRKIYRRVVA